jgi:hypothetical protein
MATGNSSASLTVLKKGRRSPWKVIYTAVRPMLGCSPQNLRLTEEITRPAIIWRKAHITDAGADITGDTAGGVIKI